MFHMMNNTTTTLQIERLNHEGRGVAHINGKTVFVEGGLPGEQVTVDQVRKHRRFDEGIAIQVEVSPSPLRVTPPCPHFHICGGCSLQHMAPHAQLAHKEQVLLEQFSHFGNLKPNCILPPLTGPTLAYRRKARLSVKYVAKKNTVLVGFREKNGRFVAQLQECPVLSPPLNKLITPLRDLVFDLEIREQIPQIEVAVAENTTALVLRHLVELSPHDIDRLTAFANERSLQLYTQAASANSIQPLLEPTLPLQYTLPFYGITFQFHPLDFIQINAALNQRMVEKAIELLQPQKEDSILDLFCGLGNFTLPLATRCRTVTGVEGDADLIQRAQHNAALNSIQNALFFSSDLTHDIQNEPWFRPYNAILLDPPRTGALEIIKQLAEIPTKRVVYVSCNPATLARDAGELVHQQGYTLEAVGVLDMFPHTAHVESIALFTRD